MAGHRLICWWPLILLIITISQDLLKRRDFLVRALRDELVEVLGLNLTEIIRLRGFNAEDHWLTTSDGYILNLVRATNPLINDGKGGLPNKSVLLAVHGTITNAKCFVAKSSGAHPADYSKYDAGSMSKEEVLQITANNTARFSLVFTALNFGHEVWLLNKRGTSYSQGHIDPKKRAYLKPTNDNNYKNLFNVSVESEQLLWNRNHVEQELKREPKLFDEKLKKSFEKAVESKKTIRSFTPKIISNIVKILLKPNFALSGLANTFNKEYWNFSLDEQALIDIPEVVDFVLKKTGRDKLSYVGHSSGAGFVLMALSVHKELNDKLSKVVLWAPALHSGRSTKFSIMKKTGPVLSIPFRYYSGGIPPTVLVPLIQKLVALLCYDELGINLGCTLAFDFFVGLGGTQQTYVPGIYTALFDSISSHEFSQLAQFIKTVYSRRFDFGSVKKNMKAYGQPTPPVYNLSTITNRGLSFWYGSADLLVQTEDIRLQMSEMKVPVEDHYMNIPGIFINHASYFTHNWIDKLIIIPSLQTIESD